MPPKAGSRHHQPLPQSQSLSLSTSAAAGASYPREHLSIARFFDAANAHRSNSSGDGGGYRVGAFSNAPPTSSSDFPRENRGIVSTGHRTAAAHQLEHHQQSSSPHWSTSTSGESSPFRQGDHGRHCEQQQHSNTIGDVSSTLQEVRRRIISDLELSGDGGRESVARLHAYRQRALRVAFGADGASRRRSSRTSRVMTGDEVASPLDARLSKPQHTPNAEDGEDDELMVASVEFSLLCPYSRLPMRYPVRSKECNHLQCCDLESWIVMLDKCRSMRDPVGPCPVCERRVVSSSLEVDLWIKSVIDQMPAGTHMVVLEADGVFRSGDTTRERRKEQMIMEVVDATQGDYENYLGDVVDDDDGVVVQRHPAKTPRASTSVSAALYTVGSRRCRSTSPAAPEEREDVSSAGGAHGAGPPLVQVKAENVTMLTAEAEAAAEKSPSVFASQDDGVVVVVNFVDDRHDGLQALPSQIRLWVPHCTRCRAPRVKAEDGLVQSCRQCGHIAKNDWNLVRHFEASPRVSMELVADGTLILQGVDLLAPYLYRAGFYRSLFEVMEYASVAERQQQQYQPPVDVWASSFSLSRFELDFLEACCARIAQGETLDSIESLIVPSLFRIPRRRRPGSSGQTSFTQLGHISGRYGWPGSATASQARRTSSIARVECSRFTS